jgi:GntR family transcriptional regulator, transcriptional repressor for pyruvate dehydrogenase complex
MSLGSVSRQSVPDQVFARLCELIVTGRYEPGQRLPTQRALAGDFGVNMGSVREAVKRLEQLRLVEVRHGDATRVLDWRRAGVEALALLGALDAKVMAPLFEARGIVLTQVARLAAQRRTDAQAVHLLSVARDFERAGSDEDAQTIEWAFISALVDAADNLVFELIGHSVRELYMNQAPRFLPLVSHRDELAPLLVGVARAVESGDPTRADLAMARFTAAQEARMLGSI